jgi:hypothetical protein
MADESLVMVTKQDESRRQLGFNDGHEAGRTHMAAWSLMMVMKRGERTWQLGFECWS